MFYLQQKEFFSLENELSTFNKIEIDNLDVCIEAPFKTESTVSQMLPFKKKDI